MQCSTGTEIGIFATLQPSSFSFFFEKAVYRLLPEDFRVTEIDENGILVPSSLNHALSINYQHPFSTTTFLSSKNDQQQQRQKARDDRKVDQKSLQEILSPFLNFDNLVRFSRVALPQILVSEKFESNRQLLLQEDGGEDFNFFASSETKISNEVTQQLKEHGWYRQEVIRVLSPLIQLDVVKTDEIQPKEEEQEQEQEEFFRCFLKTRLDSGFRSFAVAASSIQNAIDCWDFLYPSSSASASASASASTTATETKRTITFSFKSEATKEDRRGVHETLKRFVDGRNARFSKVVKATESIEIIRQVRRQREREEKEVKKEDGQEEGENQNQNQNRSNNKEQQSNNQKFVHLCMLKINMPPFLARKNLSGYFNVSPHQVQTAGTKDRRAVTLQRVSLPVSSSSSSSVETSPLLLLLDEGKTITIMKSDRMTLQLFSPQFRPSPITLGSHEGNHFSVRVALFFSSSSSSLTHHQEEEEGKHLILKRVQEISENGFSNFFGPQRFGQIPSRETIKEYLPPSSTSCSSSSSSSFNTNDFSFPVGILCAANKYKEAVYSLFLSALPDPKSSSSAKEIKLFRQQVQTAWRIFCGGDGSSTASLSSVDAASKLLPSSLTDLSEVCKALKKNNLNWRAALRSVTFELRQIWVHSAQSFIFNKLLSQLNQQQNNNNREGEKKGEEKPQLLLPLLGRETFSSASSSSSFSRELKKQVLDILSECGIDSIDSFCDECESLLNGIGEGEGATRKIIFSGTTRNAFAKPKNFQVSFSSENSGGNKNEQQEEEESRFFAEAKKFLGKNEDFCCCKVSCELGTGSFLSVLLRELLGVFPLEP